MGPNAVAQHVHAAQEERVVEVHGSKGGLVEQGNANVVGHPYQQPYTIIPSWWTCVGTNRYMRIFQYIAYGGVNFEK